MARVRLPRGRGPPRADQAQPHRARRWDNAPMTRAAARLLQGQRRQRTRWHAGSGKPALRQTRPPRLNGQTESSSGRSPWPRPPSQPPRQTCRRPNRHWPDDRPGPHADDRRLEQVHDHAAGVGRPEKPHERGRRQPPRTRCPSPQRRVEGRHADDQAGHSEAMRGHLGKVEEPPQITRQKPAPKQPRHGQINEKRQATRKAADCCQEQQSTAEPGRAAEARRWRWRDEVGHAGRAGLERSGGKTANRTRHGLIATRPMPALETAFTAKKRGEFHFAAIASHRILRAALSPMPPA